MNLFLALVPAALCRLTCRQPAGPRPVYATFDTSPPASTGLLVQHWHECTVHGVQLVSLLDPGCRCSL